ncbi:hypothetical protein O6H91_Y466400 [Diphasiastrum complanatum]|nr:hypothetical protein O6H91_Y466400 [Diphasiastrum complanatum]
MMVQDPSKGQKEVESIFERARQFGAREGNFEAPSASSGSRGSFVGTGRTLLGDVRQDQGQEKEAGAGNLPPEPVAHTITFWRNGFTVDDGPLRRLEDRANAPFLQSINRGECPSELEPNDRSIAVHVSLVKKDDEWQPPAEPRYRAFQGTGRTLGGASQSPSALSPLQSSGGLEVNAQPVQGLVVDDLKPSTSIQLRLSDGTRMVARFNHHHTIADIRGFIDAARPGSSRSYQLQIMGFPPKTLLNPTETVAQAGLLNAVVIQKV